MDPADPVIALCIQGSQAEFRGQMTEACGLYWQAWQSAGDDYQACIAAHYVARCQQSPAETLRWNLEALQRAQKVDEERVSHFYPSLYLNLGRSYEQLGDLDQARHYYDLAAALGAPHQPETYSPKDNP